MKDPFGIFEVKMPKRVLPKKKKKFGSCGHKETIKNFKFMDQKLPYNYPVKGT